MSVPSALYLSAKLLILGCTGVDPTQGYGDCPASVEAESWYGKDVTAYTECMAFTRNKDFDPTDYLPGYESYVVRCE